MFPVMFPAGHETDNDEQAGYSPGDSGNPVRANLGLSFPGT